MHRNVLFKKQIQVTNTWDFPGGTAGDAGEPRSPGLGKSPGGGHGSPLQYSCLDNPKDKGTWQTTVHRAPQSQIRLNPLIRHTHTIPDTVTQNQITVW